MALKVNLLALPGLCWMNNTDCPNCGGHMVHSLIESFCTKCPFVSDMQGDNMTAIDPWAPLPLTEGERRHAIKPMSKSRPSKSPPAPTTDNTTVEILDYITARVPLTNAEILTIIEIIK